MLLLSAYNDSIFFPLFSWFLCASPALIQITHNSKESIFKTVVNLGWMEMRQKGGKKRLVICNGSLPYRKTQLSLLTQQLISGYCSNFTWSIGKQTEIQCVLLCRRDKPGVLQCWVHLALVGLVWTIIYLYPEPSFHRLPKENMLKLMLMFLVLYIIPSTKIRFDSTDISSTVSVDIHQYRSYRAL